MRLYSFVNYYLSPLQHGLQTAHCVSDLMVRYKTNTKAHKLVVDWAVNHKTIIICRGGNSAELDTLFRQLEQLAENELGLPIVRFMEDQQSLANATTAVSVVVPEALYNVGPTWPPRWPPNMSGDPKPDGFVYNDGKTDKFYRDGSAEATFITLIKSFKLA